MRKLLIVLATLLGLAVPAHAQGTLTVAANQQQNVNGQPLAGALLYTYVINTVSLAQLTYQDINLTIPNQWPLVADQNGRLPYFYLASGAVHARLTDSAGNVQFDYPNMLVIGGAAGGGGGGGQQVDPSTIASTGDVKFRFTNENLQPGWVKLNGQTIGSATSGASGFANAAAQNLFVYLWNNCPDSHCPVTPGGRGANGLSDFNANKKIQLIDMRDATPVGRDCMDTTPCAGGLLLGNISSGGGDTADTPGAFGGVANKVIALTYLPNIALPFSGALTNGGSAYAASVTQNGGWNIAGTATNTFSNGGNGGVVSGAVSASVSVTVPTVTVTGNALLQGSGTIFPLMNPFKLGSWYMKT